MKYTLRTTYPCVIKTQTNSVELEENDALEIEDEKFLYVYPQNSYQPPFCINLTNKQDSHLFSFVKIHGNQTILLEKTNMIFVSQKEKLSFAGKICNVNVGKYEITFETENKVISFKVGNKLKEYRVFKCENFACVQCQNDFFAFSIDKEKLFHFAGNELSFDNNTLTISNEKENEQKQTKIHFNNKEIEIETQNIETAKQANENLVPFQFLRLIKKKEYDSAKFFLDEKLKNAITKEKMQEFFGNISSVLPLTPTEFLIVGLENKKYVAFDIANGKINDISIDEL